MKHNVHLVLFLYALGCVASGCTKKEQLTIENAAAVAQYDAELVKCKAVAKGDLDIFDACETNVRRTFCLASNSLQKGWPRCKEFMK